MNVQILDDAAALAQGAAEWMCAILADTSGPTAVSLSGGSTPKQLYQLLAAPPFVARVPWSRVHWFFGDERFVPPDDDQSNLKMVRQAMLGHVPPTHVHAVPTVGTTPEDAARAYAAGLAAFYGSPVLDPARPLFAITLLGLGTNGHTASLFPDQPVLDERTAWAASVSPPGEPTRITLTYPAINSSAQAAFLVAGPDKRDMLARLRRGDTTIPAGRVKPVGDLHIFADRAAAG